MRKDVLRSNVVLSLVIALQDPDREVQEDAMVSLLKIPKEEKQRVLQMLDGSAQGSIAKIACEVIERQLGAA